MNSPINDLEKVLATGVTVWYPPKTKREREYALSRLLGAERAGKLTLWAQEIDGTWCYVITEVKS